MTSLDRRTVLALLLAAPTAAPAGEPPTAFLTGRLKTSTARRFLRALGRADRRLLALDLVVEDDDGIELLGGAVPGEAEKTEIVVSTDDEGDGRTSRDRLTVVAGWHYESDDRCRIVGLFEVRSTAARRGATDWELSRIASEPRPVRPKRSFVKTELK